ncbi:disease resistance protein RGA2-like [Chenopodium quinoa]|uniref:disease resistance protein RGA2-like n=1 Tax=Chenopodium quinoa TaxID=63459 RepID=UPI000B7939FB|nr:disease resistance protein RGA2-like [Chenopodium quinoa]
MTKDLVSCVVNFVGDIRLIGREQDIVDLVDLCCRFTNNDANLKVIAIMGMGGLGKTALAKHVSQAEQVKKFFNHQIIWLTVTPTFDLMNILSNMVARLYGIFSGNLDRQTLVLMLQAKLGKEKFLIVLDDGGIEHEVAWYPKASKYLNITVLNLEMIPKEIKNLFHLQSLQIQVVERSKPNLPPLICELAKLRHIYVNCSISIPKGLGYLTDLQTLPAINLKHDCGGTLSDLALFKKLGGLLEISGLDFINGEQARSLILADKTKVCHLILQWEPDCEQALQPNGSFFAKFEANEVLEALRPNENLFTLSIYNHGGTTFPTWLTAIVTPLQNLVSLEMRNYDGEGCLNLENFRFLHILSLDLHQLSKLWIISSTSRRKIFKRELVGLASLPCLNSLWTDELLPRDLGECSPVCKSLKLISLDDYDVETLPVQLQHLVLLTSLQINGFTRLEILPDWLGKFTFLKSLSLRNLPNLKRLPSQDAMQRLHNLTKFSSKTCPFLNDKLRRK